MEIVSVFDEATRDHEAEQHTAVMKAAVHEAQEVWPFLALALSEEEFGTRLALSEDRLTTIAQRHGVSYEDLTAPLARGFAIVLEARLPGAAVKCGHCGHANPGHSDGAPCECGCTTFQPSSAKHGSVLGDEVPDNVGQGGNRDPNQAQDNYVPEYRTDSYGTHEVMPPGSVQVNHRPDKSGRYDVRQVWDPMSAYIVHQGYDIDRAHAAANKAVDDAKSKGCERARLYPIPGYQGPDKTASLHVASPDGGTGVNRQEDAGDSRRDMHVPGFTDGNPTAPYGQHPYPQGESQTTSSDPGDKVEREWGTGMGTDIGKDAARDPYSYLENHQCEDDGSGKCETCAQDIPEDLRHKSSLNSYAQIHQALMDGQDPLEWVRQQNPPGYAQSHHDSTQMFVADGAGGGNPVALTQAMEQAGTPGQPEVPGGHQDTQQGVEQPAAGQRVQQGGTGTPEQPGGHRSTQGSRLPKE